MTGAHNGLRAGGRNQRQLRRCGAAVHRRRPPGWPQRRASLYCKRRGRSDAHCGLPLPPQPAPTPGDFPKPWNTMLPLDTATQKPSDQELTAHFNGWQKLLYARDSQTRALLNGKCTVHLGLRWDGSTHAGAIVLVHAPKWCALRWRSTFTTASILGTRSAAGKLDACLKIIMQIMHVRFTISFTNGCTHVGKCKPGLNICRMHWVYFILSF